MPLPKVLLTRARGQNDELRRVLEEHGFEVVEIPLLEVEFHDQVVNQVIQENSFEWCVVTSPNGAISVRDIVPVDIKIATVGDATSAAMQRKVHLTAHTSNAEGLVDTFPLATSDSGMVLVCKSDLADQTVTSGLMAKGWRVISVVTYKVIIRPAEILRDELRDVGNLDAVVLASGSAAKGWAEVGVNVPIVTIGPKTNEVVESFGLNVAATATEQNTAGLLEAVLRAVG